MAYVPPKRPPQPTAAERNAAQHQAQTAAATDGVIEQLGRFLGPRKDRKIVSLTRQEAECVAVGAISGYELKRAEQQASELLNDSIDDIGRDDLGFFG